MTLPKHMDKFTEDESKTESMYDGIPDCENEPDFLDEIFGMCPPRKPVFLQREVMNGLDGETFRELKILSFKDLKRNCLINDEFIMVMLDRISSLEKQIKEIDK